MAKKVTKKKRVQVSSPDRSSVYNKIVTRADTIGLRLGDYEPENTSTDKNVILKVFVGQSNKRRVVTREMTEFFEKEQVPNTIESDNRDEGLANHDLNCASNVSIQETQSKNLPKSHNSSFYNLNNLEGECFQHTCISKPESPVNEALFQSQEPQNQMTESISEANFNMCATDLENTVKEYYNLFQSLSCFNNNPNLGIVSLKPQSAIPELLESQYIESQIKELDKESNKWMPTSENEVKGNCSYFQSLSCLNIGSYKDTVFRRPHTAVPIIVDSQDIEIQNTGLDEISEINIFMPESENGVKAKERSFQSLNSLNHNTFQDICISQLDASVFQQEFNAQDGSSEISMVNLNGDSNTLIEDSESENTVKSNNSPFHSSQSLIDQSFQDNLHFNPEFPVKEQFLDSLEHEENLLSVHEMEVRCCQENPKYENVQTPNIRYPDNFNSFNDNLYQETTMTLYQKTTMTLYQETTMNLYQETTMSQAEVLMQQVDYNVPENEISEDARDSNCNMCIPEEENLDGSSNSHNHSLSYPNDSSDKTNFTSEPQEQAHNHQVDSQIFEKPGPEFAKRFSLNTWIENAVDSVAAVLLPFVP